MMPVNRLQDQLLPASTSSVALSGGSKLVGNSRGLRLTINSAVIEDDEEEQEEEEEEEGGDDSALLAPRVPVDLTLSNFMAAESREQLAVECMAAVTVSLAMVPEAIGFSLTAKVSPMVGMQAAWMVCTINALFGGRPGVVCGATGSVAVLLPPIVQKYGVEGLFLCVMLAGVFQAVLGLVGFGHFLIKMMPHPVVVGFCNGLGIVIGLAQFNLMKMPPPPLPHHDRRLEEASTEPWIQGIEAFSFAVHVLLTMGICLFFPNFKRTKKLPAALTAIVFCTLLEHFVIREIDPGAGTALVRDHAGGSLSGDFPVPVWLNSKYDMPCTVPAAQEGVPAQACTVSTGGVLGDVAAVSMQVAVVGLVESLLTDNLIASLLNAPMDARRTCLANGLANLVCGAFGGMGGCATIGQSILNVKRIGSRSRFSTVLMGIILLLIILLMSAAVEEIPVASLVGIMFMIVYDTFGWRSPALVIGSFLPRPARDWAAGASPNAGCFRNFVKVQLGTKVPGPDAFTILLVSVVAVLPNSNLAYAVTAGILFKSITHVWRSAGMLVGESTIVTDAGGKPTKRIVVLHGDVFFASTEQLEKLFTNEQISADPPKVEIRCSHSHLADFSAMHVINSIGNKYKEQGKSLVITRLVAVSSRVVQEASSGNQPALRNSILGRNSEGRRSANHSVVLRTVVGDTDDRRAALWRRQDNPSESGQRMDGVKRARFQTR